MNTKETLSENEKHELKMWQNTLAQIFDFAKKKMFLSDEKAEVFKSHIVSILQEIEKRGKDVSLTSLLFYAEIEESAFYKLVIDIRGIKNYIHLVALRKYGNLVDFYDDANEYANRSVSDKGNGVVKEIPKTINI